MSRFDDYLQEIDEEETELNSLAEEIEYLENLIMTCGVEQQAILENLLRLLNDCESNEVPCYEIQDLQILNPELESNYPHIWNFFRSRCPDL